MYNTPSISIVTYFRLGPFDIGSEEKRKESLGKKTSSKTGDNGVPSPFKRNLLWQKFPLKTKLVL